MKKYIYHLLLVISSFIPALYLYDIIHFTLPSESEIQVSAPEDFLGVGFFALWIPFSIVQGILLISGFKYSDSVRQKTFVVLILIFYLVISLFSHRNFRTLRMLILGV